MYNQEYIHQLCENLKFYSDTNDSSIWQLFVLLRNSFSNLGCKCHLDSRSGSLLSSPTICSALTRHSHRASNNTNSRRHACRNLSWARPDWMTTTVLRLSHKIVIFYVTSISPKFFMPQQLLASQGHLYAYPHIQTKNKFWERGMKEGTLEPPPPPPHPHPHPPHPPSPPTLTLWGKHY